MNLPGSRKKKSNVSDFMFFFGLVLSCVFIFISLITLKNDCILLRNEIYHLQSIETSHLNRVKILAGTVKNLSRQDRIEKIARERFNLYSPAPESLIVYIGGEE